MAERRNEASGMIVAGCWRASERRAFLIVSSDRTSIDEERVVSCVCGLVCLLFFILWRQKYKIWLLFNKKSSQRILRKMEEDYLLIELRLLLTWDKQFVLYIKYIFLTPFGF